MSLQDDLLKHKIFVQRMTKKQMSYMIKYVQRALTEARTYEGTDLNKLKEVLKKILRQGVAPSIEALQALSDYEIKFIARLLKKYNDRLKEEAISVSVAALSLAMITGGKKHSLQKSYEMFADRKAEEFVQTIVDNRGGTKKAIFIALGLLAAGMMVTQLRSLSSSAINRVVEEVHVQQYRSNGIYQLRWLNTLDPQVNTCLYCAERDQEIFNLGDEDVAKGNFPPHVNCRCTLEPVFVADRV